MRRVGRLRARPKGILVKAGRGNCQLKASVQAVSKQLRKQAAGRSAKSKFDLVDERAGLAKEQVDAVELKNAQVRGGLIPAAEAASTWSALMVEGRQRMLATVNGL